MLSVLLLLVMALAAGHAAAADSTPVETSPGGVPSAKLYINLKAKQDWARALEVARAANAQPVLRTDSYLASIRIVGIDALAHYGKYYGADPRLDDEALAYYQDGLRYARGDSEGRLHRIMALYYSFTRRNGLALPYMRKELEHWKSAGNTYQVIAAYDGLGSAYSDMGELELREYYSRQALDVAKGYFVLGASSATPNQWLQYEKMLFKRMDRAARPGNAAEVQELWTVIEPIVNRYVKPKSFARRRAAVLLAAAGDTQRAMEFFETATQIWGKERQGFSQDTQVRADSDFACALGAIRLRAGAYTAAITELDRCAQLRTSTGLQMEDMAFPRNRGRAYEGAGDLDRAIDAYRVAIAAAEKLRGSYAVAERATFFRSAARPSYWGLIRVLTRRGVAKNDPADFGAALRASELMRARQLGDILDDGSEAELSAERLERLRRDLRPDELVLAYTLTDEDIVVLALTRDRQVGAVTAYNGEKLREEVLGLAKDLAEPGSDQAHINARLSALSRVLLGPVAELLADKRTIVVIPDGIINAIPFDLLSRQPSEYRALIDDYTVRLAPSLRLMEQTGRQRRERRGGGLFALGDPAYAKGTEIAGLSAAELRGVTRGSQYLRYFNPLPETRSEVEAIARLFGGERVATLFGSEATESAVKRADLHGFRYIHFATHGIIGGDLPGLSEPALVFANEDAEDGFLTATEAQSLKLDADLTVLSACKTGSGELFTGEGVMGMSRAFLVAGSKSVLVSLWSVDSKATERLMVAFYRHLRGGMEAPEALRKAKLEMIEAARAPGSAARRNISVQPNPAAGRPGTNEMHPFFWAPFILFGG